MAATNDNVLGQGTFGTVVARNGRAVKTFRRLDHMIQEVIMTLYMNDSPYTVNIMSYNFSKLTMETERWSCDLKNATIEYIFSPEEKMKIFEEIITGLCHIHSRLVTHSDLKPSNILLKINNDNVKACIADMGLTSASKYAKVRQTAPAYRPATPVPVASHDMFGLAVTMTEFFGGIKLKKTVSAARLREIIRININNTLLRDTLVKMCPDNPRDAVSASMVLETIFKKKSDLPRPVVKNFENHISTEDTHYIKNTLITTMAHTKVYREARCYYCLIAYFNNPDNQKVEAKDYPLYMCTAIMIFSAIFGKPGFGIEEIKSVTVGKYSSREIIKTLNSLIGDSNFVNFVMMPGIE